MTEFKADDWIVTFMAPQIDHLATGERLRTLRMERGLSLRGLGARMNHSAPYLCDLERGRRNWNADLVRRYVLSVEGA